MKRLVFNLVSIMVAGCMLAPASSSRAADVSSLSQQAQAAAAAGKTSRALALYELALTQSAVQPDSVTGPLVGQYWQLIAKSDDFPRALDFFSAFALEHKNPGATVLANRANAIGSYFGWLYENNLMGSLPPAKLEEMDGTARSNYARALALDPDNFSALYGYAIYESYSPRPNAKAHMRELLAKLNSLRGSHPHYPWEMVDSLEQHGHPQQ